MKVTNVFTSEQVSAGHPDKICDQISDAIVTECLRQDKNSRVAAECMIKGYQVIIAGELTTKAVLDFDAIVKAVLNSIGLEDVDKYMVSVILSQQSSDIAKGVDKEGAGDQGMMFGYATNETKIMLPIPFVAATRALEILRDKKHSFLCPDAKSQVSYNYRKKRIDTFLISSQHKEETTVEDIRPAIEEVMLEVAEELNLNANFKRLVNPTGRFVIGSSFADSGLTGRKIIADTYGGMCRHGGGAFSGKDPTKVDRSGAYIARQIARRVVNEGFAERCEVQLAYAIGIAEPVSVYVECFGTNKVTVAGILKYVKMNFDMTPQGIISSLNLRNVDYNLVSAYGHFGKPGLPWEA